MNSFDTIAERRIAVETIKEEMEKKLDLHHYNPITKTYMFSNSEELNPNLFIEEALSIARTKLNGSEYHLNRIKADLIRIGKSIQSLGYDTLLIKDVKIWHIKNILENMGLTPSAFNKVRQYMLSLFKELIQYGCIEYNPVRDIEKKVEVAKLREILPDEKFRVLFKSLKENHYEFYRYAMIFYYSGGRSSELLRLQKKDVYIDKQEYRVLIKKGNQYIWETKVIIPQALPYWKEILEESIFDEDYIFGVGQCPSLKKVEPCTITRKWKRWVKNNLNIKDENGKSIIITEDLYSLKHLFLDKLDNLSNETPIIDINFAQQMASHRSNKTTGIYAVGRKNRTNEYLKNIKIS